jgi:hypothetical protein
MESSMNATRLAFVAVIAATMAVLVMPVPGVGAVGYTVDTTSDANLVACTASPGDCSLRGAINNANASGAADVITFDAAVFPAGAPATITVNPGLPAVSGASDTIDGTGSGVIIDGLNVEPDFASFACLTVQANLVTIKGLQMTDCNPGVLILSGMNNTIGPGNVIFDNGTGVWNASPGSGNKIIGSMIGTTANGAAVHPDGANTTGIMAVGNGGLVIGGTGAGEGNVISGSVTRGVEIQGNNTSVQGNKIGTDAGGTADLGNGSEGVYVVGTAANIVIGGASVAARNVVSGNGGYGIRLASNGTNVSVQGNYVGTDATGSSDLGNSLSGVLVGVGFKSIFQNVISGNDQEGVHLTASNNFVQGNFIGTNAAGTAALANVGAGVLIGSNQTDNSVGGSTAAERNIISGNGAAGIELASASTGNPVRGNYVGTDASGTFAISNGGSGIKLTSTLGNTIGGSGAGEGNLISGNAANGIELSSASNVTVFGNRVGTQVDGATPLGNGSSGIVFTSSNGNSIGSSGSFANTIAFNTGAGVWVQSGIGNTIGGNSIHANGGLGIDVSTVGVTVNDAGDPDTGANNRQNFPVLSLARTDGSSLVVDGSLNSFASSSFGLRFYATDGCDVSGHGEGRTYLGFNSYSTDVSGNLSFSKVLGVPVAAGQAITATANGGGDTSEFSACMFVQQDSDLDGILDMGDNCPNWANPSQTLPAWTVPANDADCDGFDAAREEWMGTDPAKHCPNTATANDEAVDAWPTDFNDSRLTSLADVVLMGPAYNQATGADAAKRRFDLNASGNVSLADVVLMGPFYNKGCS